MDPWISNRMGQFAYFDQQLGHPDWSGVTVLDFGGNVGNMLLDPGCAIEPDKYWCLDVVREAIELGQRRHPLAHFVFYDRYNFEYNPDGIPDLPVPDLGQRFDVIVSYSAFAHTSRTEMRALVGQLWPLLTDGGVLAFTFIDPYFEPPEDWGVRDWERPGLDNLMWQLVASPKLNGAAAKIAADARRGPLTWATLVNNEDLVLEPNDDWIRQGDERSQYIAFCTEEHMRSIYPDAEIHSPVPPERHSCCVLRKPQSDTVHTGP